MKDKLLLILLCIFSFSISKAQTVIWQGFDFHRQKPIDSYIVDFFCNKLMLAIELDGITHHYEEQFIKDKIREECLTQIGIKILRFDDEEVYYDIDNVLNTIECFIDEYIETHPR